MNKNILHLVKEVALIKQAVCEGKETALLKQDIATRKDDEGALTDWAQTELEKARAEPDENYTSLDDIKRELLT